MLLIRPKPQAEESMIGYLYRLSGENGYPTLSPVKQLLHANHREMERNLLSDNSIHMLGADTGYEWADFISMTSRDIQPLIYEHQYNQLCLRQFVQYCPACVQVKPIHQKDWCFSAINICHIHKTWLQGVCRCGKGVNHLSLIKGRCLSCDTRLMNIFAPEEQDRRLIKLQDELHQLLVSSHKTITIFNKEVGVKAFLSIVKHSLSLLHDTTSFLYEGMKIKDHTRRGKHNLRCCLSYFEVIEMYRNFPDRFIQVLEEQKSKPPSAQTISKNNFEKLLLDPAWDQIKIVYTAFLNENKASWTVRKTPSVLNASEFSHLSRTAASHFLGVPIDIVKKLIEQGFLHEVEVGFEKKIPLVELRRILEKCKGEQKDCTGRVSLRDVIQMYPANRLNVTGIILLILGGVLVPASEVSCGSILDVTFDRSELNFCFKAATLSLSLKGVIKMKDPYLNEFQMGLASVTGQGIVFNGSTFTNAKMVKSQWFDAAEKHGEWTIPVLYKPESPDYLVLYDLEGLEVASAVEPPYKVDKDVLDAYHEAINELKLRLVKKKEE